MVILGVDYGYARTGIAICDPSETICSPVETIKQSYMPKVAKRVATIANERHAELVVVGLPLNMDGTAGEHAQASDALATMLKEEYSLNVKLVDERLTTVEAYNMLDESKTFGKRRKQAIDQVAATIILQDFIKSAHSNGEK